MTGGTVEKNRHHQQKFISRKGLKNPQHEKVTIKKNAKKAHLIHYHSSGFYGSVPFSIGEEYNE